MSSENMMRRHRPARDLSSAKEAETKISQKQISIRLDPDLHRRFATTCRGRDETMTEILIAAIEEYVSSHSH